jgi:hypothetical protein
MIGNERYQRREDLLVLFGKLADREESKALGEVRQLKHELPNGDVEIYNFYHRGAGLVMELVDMQHPAIPALPESVTATIEPVFVETVPALPINDPVFMVSPVVDPASDTNGGVESIEELKPRKRGPKPKVQQ